MRPLLVTTALLFAVALLGVVVVRPVAPPLDRTVSVAVQRDLPASVAPALEATSRSLYKPWNFILMLVLAGIVWWRAGPRGAMLLVACVLSTLALVEAAKRLYARPRPPATLVEGAIDSICSYPSGHVAWAAAALGTLALVLTTQRGRALRVVAMFFAVLAVAWVALSRIYLGRHYLSDTIAGALLGWACVTLFSSLLWREPKKAPSLDAPGS